MKKHLLLLVITITVLILLQINFLLGQTPYLDPTFDISPGFDRPADLPNSSVYVVKVQSDGKILVGGGFNSFNGKPYHGVIRLNPNGGIDSSFKIGEGFNGPVYAIALQEDGKIVVGGEFSYYNYIRNSLLIRLNSDGSFDTTFHPFTAHWYGCVNNAIEIINGKIVFGYYFSEGFYGNIYRLNSDGSQDNSFKISELYNGNIYTIKEIQGHKLLIGGSFNALGKNKINYLNCINYDGTQNTSFNNRIGFNSTVYSINQSGDGKIIIGGMFDAAFVNSVKIPAGRIIRINSDGSLDMTFNPVPGFDKTVRNLLVQDNGKIIVAGSFDLYKNTTQHKISCLNSDGSIFSNDISFSGFDSSVYSMELQDDDKLLAGGAFTTYNNNLSEGLVRLYFEDSSQTFQAKIDNGRTFFTGDSIRISITTNMDFNPGNIFYVQLSDTDGYFTNNFIIDTIQAINNIYFYTKLPDNLPTSDMYKIRILSSSPLIVAGINKNISIVNPKIIGSKTVCTNSIFTYYTNLFGDIQYEWNIYGGEFQGLRTPWSKDVKWTKLGLGSITLIENISNTNSSRTITMPVFVVSAPNPDITGPQLICINNEAIYTTLKADSTLNSWNTTSNPSYWKLLSDTSIVLMWSKAGDYTLTLKQSIPQTSCEKDVNITIKVMDKIKPVINGNNKVIVNSPYLYTVTGFTNSVEHWYVYGGNITGSPNEDSVLIYWDKPGTGTIYLVQSLGETGCSSSTFMDVQISDVKSVNEGTQNIYVFPNPSSDNLIIVFSNCDFQNAEIMLLDLLGEEVYSQKYESINKDFNLTIDTHQLPVGVYLLKINCGRNICTEKVIIQR